MPASPGSTTDARTVATFGTTNTSPAFTCPARSMGQGDVGRAIAGTGIPAATTVLTVNAAGTGGTLSANATATGTITATVGATGDARAAAVANGFLGWAPQTEAERITHTFAQKALGTADPAAFGDNVTPYVQRAR